MFYILLRRADGRAGQVNGLGFISISGTGTEVVVGMVGASLSWLVNISQVFVCERGNSIQTGFPNGLRAKIAAGAKLGRCEHLDD